MTVFVFLTLFLEPGGSVFNIFRKVWPLEPHWERGNSITATLIYSSFVRKIIFYSKNIQYAYDFYRINVYRGVFRIQPNIYGRASLRKPQKASL